MNGRNVHGRVVVGVERVVAGGGWRALVAVLPWLNGRTPFCSSEAVNRVWSAEREGGLVGVTRVVHLCVCVRARAV